MKRPTSNNESTCCVAELRYASPASRLLKAVVGSFAKTSLAAFILIAGCEEPPPPPPPPPPPTPAPTPTPTPAPKPGGKGTPEFWQRELKGKSKSQVKAEFGTPASIQDQGYVYVYKNGFFHPDLDQWRDLLVTFATTKDELAVSFTGSGGDTKAYSIEVPAALASSSADIGSPAQTTSEAESAGDQLGPSSNMSAGAPTNATATSGVATNTTETAPGAPKVVEAAYVMEDIRKQLLSSVVTIKFTEPSYAGLAEGPLIDTGSGATGFLVQYQGKKYILTNIHVLEGEASTEIQEAWINGPRANDGASRVPSKSRTRTSLEEFLAVVARFPLPVALASNGSKVKMLPNLLLSASRDIALIPAETDAPALIISDNPLTVGSKLLVAGNSNAGNTIIFREGTVSAEGPERFDVAISSEDSQGKPQEAKLETGMSGSPVLDLQTGKVAGVISYRVERPSTWIKDDVVNSPYGPKVIRLYVVNISNVAYRLDNADDFQAVSWAQFLKDYAIYWAMRERAFNVRTASQAVDISIAGTSPQALSPDFDNKVQVTYSSFCRDFKRILDSSDGTYVKDAWDNYSRRLEQILREPRDNAIATAYIRKQLAPIAATSTAQVIENLRQAAGKVSSLAQQKKQ